LFDQLLGRTRFPAVVTRVMTALALVAAVIAVAVHLATYGPVSWAPLITAVWPLLFVAIFPIAGSAIVVLSLAQVPIEELIGDLPLAIKIDLVAARRSADSLDATHEGGAEDHEDHGAREHHPVSAIPVRTV
jgi:hypothetical protein